jgi:hypothetical protein
VPGPSNGDCYSPAARITAGWETAAPRAAPVRLCCFRGLASPQVLLPLSLSSLGRRRQRRRGHVAAPGAAARLARETAASAAQAASVQRGWVGQHRRHYWMGSWPHHPHRLPRPAAASPAVRRPHHHLLLLLLPQQRPPLPRPPRGGRPGGTQGHCAAGSVGSNGCWQQRRLRPSASRGGVRAGSHCRP